MERRYSILIVTPREARVRRLGFTLKSAATVALVATLFLGLIGWLMGDYLWSKIETENLNRLKIRATAQREQYFRLHGQAQNIQTLLADWKALREKIDASVPQQQRLSPKSRYAIAEVQQSLNSLQTELERMLASLPTEWPAAGRVTSGVGDRVSPLSGRIEFHSGLDIPNPIGTPVYAPGNATVETTGETNGNGRTVVLNHGQGITTQYLHLSKIHVNPGQKVRKGQQIAEVGNTGHSTSPHLHYEVRVNGVAIDPRRSLLK